MSKYHLSKPVNIISLNHCFAPSYSSDFYFSGERHDFWECVFVVEGKVGIAEDEKIYELSKNDIIFHKPMEFHRIWSSSGTCPKLIISSFTADGFGLDSLSEGVFSLDKTAALLLFEASEIAIKSIINQPDWKNDYISQQLFANKLESMMLYILSGIKASLNENNSTTANNYKKIITIMNNNLDKPLTINELSRLTNLSPSNLKKCFRKYSGMGVIRYFNRLKIMKADHLIREGFSMNEISDMLGFSSQNYFSTAFKREHGVSPLEYKKTLW